MSYQVQVRFICPEWLKVKKLDSSSAAVLKHHDTCPEHCGYSDGDAYKYKFMDLADFVELLGKKSDDSGEDPAPPVKRERKPKAAAAVEPTPPPVKFVDPLDDDGLDDLL